MEQVGVSRSSFAPGMNIFPFEERKAAIEIEAVIESIRRRRRRRVRRAGGAGLGQRRGN